MSEKECVELLITAIKDSPIIYDLKHRDHKNKDLVMLAWEQISEILKDTFPVEDLLRAKLSNVEDLKNKFHTLR